MKKIRLLFIISICIILAGCKQEYNLIIDNDKIVEEYNVIVEDTEENNKRLELDYYPIHADDTKKYNKKVSKENNMLNVHMDYTYVPKDFSNANSINQCFDTKQVIVDDENYYYFRFGSINNCMTDYNMDINIITKNKVLKHNADQVKGKKYTWHLTNENKEKFNLEIMIKKNKKIKFPVKKIIIISVVSIFIIILIALVLKKKNKSNRV